MNKSVLYRAVPVLGLGIIAVSFASIFIKLCDAPAFVIAAYRMGIASLFYLSVSGIKNQRVWQNLDRSQLGFILISALFLTLHFATWISSLKFTSVASSVILVQSAPVFVALGSAVFLKEKPSFLMIIGAVITLAGSVIVSVLDFSMNENSLTGNILAIGGAIGAAGYLLAGRKLRARLNTLQYVSTVYSITAVLLILMAIMSRAPLFNYSPSVYVLFFAIALMPQVIGHTSFNWALKYFSATAVSIAVLGEPIGATILAFFILGEKITLVKFLGGVVILIGVVIALVAEAKSQSQNEEQIE